MLLWEPEYSGLTVCIELQSHSCEEGFGVWSWRSALIEAISHLEVIIIVDKPIGCLDGDWITSQLSGQTRINLSLWLFYFFNYLQFIDLFINILLSLCMIIIGINNQTAYGDVSFQLMHILYHVYNATSCMFIVNLLIVGRMPHLCMAILSCTEIGHMMMLSLQLMCFITLAPPNGSFHFLSFLVFFF